MGYINHADCLFIGEIKNSWYYTLFLNKKENINIYLRKVIEVTQKTELEEIFL